MPNSGCRGSCKVMWHSVRKLLEQVCACVCGGGGWKGRMDSVYS